MKEGKMLASSRLQLCPGLEKWPKGGQNVDCKDSISCAVVLWVGEHLTLGLIVSYGR
jgi:hypothetical protein